MLSTTIIAPYIDTDQVYRDFQNLENLWIEWDDNAATPELRQLMRRSMEVSNTSLNTGQGCSNMQGFIPRQGLKSTLRCIVPPNGSLLTSGDFRYLHDV